MTIHAVTEPETSVTPMELYRKEYPKIRGRVIGGTEYFIVDMRRAGYVGTKTKTFTDLAEAKKFASEIASKVRNTGLSSLVSNLDPRMPRWQEQANLVGLTLDEIFNLGIKAAVDEKAKAASPLMHDLLEQWYVSKEQNKMKPLRPDSLRACCSMKNRFQADFGQTKIAEIDRQFVMDYLNGQECGNVYRDNLRNYIGQFFFWAIKEGYAKENPAKGIEIDTNDLSAPEYYSVDMCEKIMIEASKTPEMVPYFALCLFCGIRPTECQRLEWWSNENKWGVNIETGYIVMTGSITKTKTGRQFDIPKNCLSWLRAYKVDGKPLIPVNFRNAFKDITKTFNGSWIQDGMRHTYATFAYALHHSLPELAHVMGNSPGIIEKFYRGQIAENDVQAFWNITPESIKAK